MDKIDAVKRPKLAPPSGDSQCLDVTNNWCVTKTNKKHSLTWTIENFNKRQEEIGEYIESSLFPAEPSDTKWRLKMYPKGQREASAGHISVFLAIVQGSTKKQVKTSFSLSLLNDKHERIKTYNCTYTFEAVKSWGWHTFHERTQLIDGLLPDDKLTIHCQVEVFGEPCELSDMNTNTTPSFTCTLATDLWKTFENQTSTDIIITVGSTKFKVHKTILIARSPVFDRMFSLNMKKSQYKRVKVSDVDSDVFNEVLRYIYTGKVIFDSAIGKADQESQSDFEDKYSFAIKLLNAASKYQMDGLKLLCEHRLCNLMSADSVVTIMSLANQYSVDWLKDQAIQFTISHAKELTKKGVWQSLLKDNPEMMMEVIARQWPADSR